MTRPKRSLGQHFLVDAGIQRRIVETLEPEPGDEVLEIGPGRGALTRHLAGRVRRLVAIELDDELAAELRRRYADSPGVEIVHADVLETDLESLVEDVDGLKVVGNLPYNITSPVLAWLLERPVRPAAIVVMVQREVADRIAAGPDGKTYGALSVGVQAVARVERAFTVGRGAFRPVPRVDSAVLRIEPLRPPPIDAETEADLRALVRASFRWRRKQLQTILRRAPGYGLDRDALREIADATGIDLRRRPETLSPAQFIELARRLRARGYPTHDGGA
ncbi:MAG: 16S rRNA (adenine(1518)-N(6)/adenine(1519)-N(6))-dimethyltransferase RsmA [Gemmatimonadota bacterium]